MLTPPPPVVDSTAPSIPSKPKKIWKGSKEAAKRRDGFDPNTGLLVRNCVCTNVAGCRAIMRRYAAIGDEGMCRYITLPSIPKKDETPTGQHIIQVRENFLHHLFGHGSNDVKEDLKLKKGVRIALHHFHPLLRPLLVEDKEKIKIDRYRVPSSLAKQCDLKDSDLCQIPANQKGDKTFITSPSFMLHDATAELEEAEREFTRRRPVGENCNPNLPSGSGRKTPRDRMLEQIARDVVKDPMQAAIRQHDMAEEIRALKDQLQKSKEESAAEKERMKEDFEEQKARLVDELIHSGLNRKSILSEKYHQDKPWVSKFFFGLPWGEHKARGRALFTRMVPGFTCDVSGDGDIAEFEKYCICSMIAWQGLLNPTVAAVYGRTPQSISNYRREWMPRLGLAGAYLSELDMEMNHNFLPIDLCKEEKAGYIVDGIAFNINLSDE